MDLEKIELLIKKINQAIKTIQRLKEAELKYQEEIKRLNNDNSIFQEENLILKKEIQSLKYELQNNNILYKELENKIVDILKYLPDEETENFVEDNITPAEKPYQNYEEELEKKEEVAVDSESEEDMLKNFVKEQHVKDDKGLFFEEKENIKESQSFIEPKRELSNESANPFLGEKGGQMKKEFELKFEETLLDNSEEKEIDFSFENIQSKNNSDLPKGVL